MRGHSLAVLDCDTNVLLYANPFCRSRILSRPLTAGRKSNLDHTLSAKNCLPNTSFSALQETYNFLNFSSYGEVFTGLLLEAVRNLEQPSHVLDIGCGCGIGRDSAHQWSLRESIKVGQGSQFWGIEPDQAIQAEEGLFDNFQHALMEDAELPPERFDIAYSSMVMEHVAEPAAFLTALQRCLKPGGAYYFVTPNARSIVPWATKILHQLKLDELALSIVRKPAEIEEYHYPVQFLFNTPKQIENSSEKHGFHPPECIFLEGHGSYSYFRGPLKILKAPLQAKRRVIQRKDRLATLICKIVRKG